MNWITENYDAILKAIGAFYVFATAVAYITPTDKDNTLLEKLGNWADRLGFKIKGK
jgi:hypothetical protein|tara:strand:+ start:539 stop:706 length:168 start_codon:yes stop_codon:yes gene_type:complete